MTEKKKIILFSLCSYAFFWLSIILMVAAIATGILSGEGIPMQLMIVFLSWTPTFTLLLLFKKINPSSSVKSFYQNAFQNQINIRLLLFIIAIQMLILLGAAGMTSVLKGIPPAGLLKLSASTICTVAFWTLIQGATGEESAWRGYLQPAFEKKYGLIKASVLVGIIQGLGNAPLWLMEGLDTNNR